MKSISKYGFVLLASLLCLSQASCGPMAVGSAAALGVAAAREGGLPKAVNDVKIKAHISDRWFKYDTETFARLSATVEGGRVLLTGVVDNPDDRVEAVRLAWQVEGVKQVINEIRIADSEGIPGYVRDKWITVRLRTALTFEKEVQSINYTIDTVQGTVYLMGIAYSEAELNKAIEVARTIPHVKRVVSYVKVLTEADTAGHVEPQLTDHNQ